MQLYLPIAEVSVNAIALVGIGGIVGFLSGLFGVGGGFLITPLLFFIGIPPAVAVATGSNQVVASSISGVLAQLAAAVAQSQSNIERVDYLDRDVNAAQLRFAIQVRDRNHLAEVIRRLRRLNVVQAVRRQ